MAVYSGLAARMPRFAAVGGDNIAAFGGDPGRVTVGGQSSGAVAAMALLTSPPAAGLFHRVFEQSGPPRNPDARPV